MDKETKKNIQEVINALLFCDKEGAICKKCRKKSECLLFIRSSIAVCLRLFLNKKSQKDSLYS